ncbi:SsrA-binding protein SmpB [Candidatus Uhrbacteria bacterium]|jgi:SsrA-binding protein|nr:SsrA-binding protein SmpB [Candidatus Uhrbacteria bacterium]
MPTLAVNKKALFDYDILQKYEGGLVLSGPEVKSIKGGQVQLKGAFLHIKKGELWLKNSFVAAYKPAGPSEDYDPYADRKVLVHKREFNKLIGKQQAEGLTIVPLSIYTKGDLIKLAFAIGRGKKKYEKRESIKKRDVQRQMQERMKGNRE